MPTKPSLLPVQPGISRSILALLFGIGIIPLCILTMIFFFFYFEARKEEIGRYQEALAEKIALGISAHLDRTSGQIQVFAEFLANEAEGDSEVRQMLHRFLEQGTEFDTVTLADATGKEIQKVSRYYTFRPFELEMLPDKVILDVGLHGGGHIGPVGISRYSTFPRVNITVPVRGRQDQVKGMLRVGVNILKMWNLISGYRIGKNRYAYVVDEDGGLIAFQDVSSVLEKRSLTGIEGVSRFMADRTGVAEYRGLTGEEVIGSHAEIPRSGWGVIVEEPVRTAYQDIYLLFPVFAGIAVLTITCALILGLRFSYAEIIRPLKRLQERTGEIAEGTYDLRIEDRPVGEFGALAEAVNRMVKDLKRKTVSRDRLVQEVRKRRQTEADLREERDRAQKYLDIAGVIILALDNHGRVTLFNRKGREILGYGEDEILGKSWSELVIPEKIRSELNAHFHSIIGSPEADVWNTEHRVIAENGEEKLISWTCTMLRNECGEVAGTLSSGEDVTARRSVEAERVRLATAIEQAAEVVIVTDTAGAIQYVNPAFERVFGYDRAEMLGRHADSLGGDGKDEAQSQEMWKTLTDGRAWSGHIVNRRKDGGILEMDATISPIRDQNGEIVSFVSVQRDVTHEIDMERRLHQAQKMEAIGTLAGGIAHDFNNILSAVIGYTELCLEDTADGTLLHTNLKEVYRAAERARDLVKQILTFSRQREHEKKPVMVKPIVKEALKLLRATLPTTIDIHTELQSDALVLADATQIHQLLMNLCTNAGHAMRQNGGRLEVTLDETVPDDRTRALRSDLSAGPYVRLRVGDTGHGMTREMTDRIFEPYFTTKDVGEGTGMGLAVVHGIVQGLNGDISVYSELNRGTRFEVLIPMIRTETIHPVPPERPSPTGKERVLLVDDEKPIADICGQMLHRLGYEVTTRTSSIEALSLFEKKPDFFDLVITDMTMPNLTGEELAKRLTKIRPGIPILLCTGYSDTMDEAKARFLGIRGFLMKPVLKSELADEIRKLLDNPASSDGSTGSV